MARVRAASEVLGPVIGELEQVFEDLAGLAGAMARLAGPPGARRELRRADLAQLRPMIGGLLAGHRGLVAGAGVITAPGLLTDAPRWLEWWWTTTSGSLEGLRVNLDPGAPDFYDYTTAAWFVPAAAPGARLVAGPYVDHACTGEYTLTLSTPVPASARPIGVAAADVLTSSLEARVMPTLTSIPCPAALASGDGRIIASNSPRWPPGLRLPPGVAARGEPAGQEPSPAGHPSPFRSWLLVAVEDAGPAPTVPGRWRVAP